MKNTITYSILILTFGVMLIGCMSEKKLAKKCAERFPPTNETEVRIREITDTLEVPGEVIYVNCDSVIEWIHDPIVRVPCPPVKVITKTIVKDSIVKIENTAKVRLLQIANQELEVSVIAKDKEIAKVTESRNDWRKWAIITWVIMAILLAIKLFGGYVKGLIRPVG